MSARHEPDELRPATTDGFPPATRQEWRARVSAVLLGAPPARGGRSGPAIASEDPELALATQTYDGIAVRPLYTAADVAELPAAGGPGRLAYGARAAARTASTDAMGWDVRIRSADPDPARAGAAIRAELATGATSVWLAAGDRVDLTVDDLAAALDGVDLERVPIALDAGAQARAGAFALLTLAQQRGIDAASLSGSLGADPIGWRARTGAEADLDTLLILAQQSKAAPRLRVATVDATIYHDAGASDAQELAIATAVGVAYLRALTNGGAPASKGVANGGAPDSAGIAVGGGRAGLSVDDALSAIEFRFALTDDQFAGIAKLRVARRLWARVAELSGAPAAARDQRQHAVTSAAMLTRRDPWVNMLRSTIACFAAAIGGADAITVRPFDSAIGASDDFARRIARNTQSILHDEAGLARVLDPGGGSWYLESLTHELSVRAWELFTAIERGGGALAALDDGSLTEQIGAIRARRADDIAHRRAPITGVSEYAFPAEPPVIRPPAPAPSGAGPLRLRRWAEGFEALRERSDAQANRPRVFLAALGPVAEHGLRLDFARNLFAAGGLDSVVGTGEPDALVDAFGASGTPVVCLCSSDSAYAERAAAEAAALKAAGARLVWLAGEPGTRLPADHCAGVDGYIDVGCDALEVLARTLDAIGVPQ